MGGWQETVGTFVAGGGMVLLSVIWIAVRKWIDAEFMAWARRKREGNA